MNIYFSPISMLERYSLEALGDSIVINGQQHRLVDLAAIGGEEKKPKFVVAATLESVTLLLPYWGSPSDEVCHPLPMFDVPDGPVELPR